MITIREYLLLAGEEDPAGINQVNAGKIARLGNLLGAQMLFNCKRVIGSPFYCGIVRKYHALLTLDPADTCDNPGSRYVVTVHFIRGKLGELQKWRASIKQLPDTLTGEQLATFDMLCA